MTSETASQTAPPTSHGADPVREVSGRVIVISLMLFGIAATSILWFYWSMHVLPFMPLQLALEEQFENSSPRVEGGQQKMHKRTPLILRVVMRVEFDPEADSEKSEERFQAVAAVVRQHADLLNYEFLEVHFYHPDPENELRQLTINRSVEDLPEAG